MKKNYKILFFLFLVKNLYPGFEILPGYNQLNGITLSHDKKQLSYAQFESQDRRPRGLGLFIDVENLPVNILIILCAQDIGFAGAPSYNTWTGICSHGVMPLEFKNISSNNPLGIVAASYFFDSNAVSIILKINDEFGQTVYAGEFFLNGY